MKLLQYSWKKFGQGVDKELKQSEFVVANIS